MVGNHEPTTVPLFEHVRNEGIEAQRIAVLAQQLHLLDPDGPRHLPVDVNAGFRQRDGDAVELAETHFPALPDAVAAMPGAR